MATAKDCFAENVRLIGQPPIQDRQQALLWNLSNGLRMLAEQIDQMQSDQRKLGRAVDDIQGKLRNMR